MVTIKKLFAFLFLVTLVSPMAAKQLLNSVNPTATTSVSGGDHGEPGGCTGG